MKDNDLITLFAAQMESAVALAGWDVVVVQAYQPTQEGVASKTQVSFEKLFDHEYGWPMESAYVLDSFTQPGNLLPDFSQFGEQWVESTFQVTVLSPQMVTDLSMPTPSDIAHQLKLYLNARVILATFSREGVAVLRITDIRNPKFKDDHDTYESNPNFDVVLQHKRKIVFKVPGSNEVVGDIVGVEEGV